MSNQERSKGYFSVDDLDNGGSDEVQEINISNVINAYKESQTPVVETASEPTNNSTLEDQSGDNESDNTTEEIISDDQKVTDTNEEFSFQPFIETLYAQNILPEDLDIDSEGISDDIDGFKKVIEKGVEFKINKALEDRDSKLSEATKKRIAIELSGGSIEELYGSDEPIDYNTIDIEATEDLTEEDASYNQELLYTEYLTDLGHSEQEIETLLEEGKISGTLKRDANIAKRYLVKRDEEKIRDYTLNKKKEQELAVQRAIEEEEKFKNKITNLRELGGFSLDKPKADKFYEFITKRDKEGKTEFDKKFTEQNALLFQYLLMEGFDKVITYKKQAETQATKQLKKTLHKFKPAGTVALTNDEPLDHIITKIPDIFNVKK